ncbi:MAG: hypothetical protein UV73_C0005G0007 [Candidatus Gottesmanbacteria bacterium GW2011_GWA2_43_14]|uniref:Nitroreductase domain-containing protein n=1 Tax=Candidatus Gottesmanbacteria bacterium GW2011_GWA2_43_14 TaxID=1618443 RepID=A0A0G1DIR4_9BACT|nr:MAG: hypothetical protein UV73_C0005G0007 [Candidatus Gottesmanbacteria bacterium GW2011_GWA2_43_14]
MKISSHFSQLLSQIEGRLSISDIFHKKTNNRTLKTNDNPNDWPDSWKKIYFKTYPRFEKKHCDLSDSDEIDKLLRNRRSIRKFTNKPISFKELSHLLYFSCGLIHTDGNYDNSRRPYPSAGGRYPLEVYPIILNVDGLKKGLYHYNIRDNDLEILLEENLSLWVSKTFGRQDWTLHSSVLFIITSVLDRNRIKYYDRGYRFSLLEAGHLGQNICLLAEKRKLGSCPLGGYIDSEVDKLLDIQNTKEVTLYAVAVGKV